MRELLKIRAVTVAIIATTLFLLLLFFNCSRGIPKDTVAVIGNDQLTKADLFTWIHPIGFEKLNKAERKDTLERYLNYQIVLKELKAIGGDRDEDLVKKMATWKTNRLRKLLYQKEVAGEVYSQANLKELYDQLKWKRNVNFIMIRYSEERNREEAHDLAWEVYEKARTMDFEELAREYSDKHSHKKNGGSLGWVDRYGLLNADLDSIIWSMEPGTISEPCLSGNEYLVVKVNQEKKVKTVSFEESQDYLKEYAAFAWRDKLRKYDIEYQHKMEDEVKAVFDRNGIDKFITNFTAIFDTIKTDKSLKNNPLEIIRKIEQPVHIGSYGDTEMNKEWLLDKLTEQQNLVSPIFTKETRLMILLNDIVFLEMLDLRVRQLGLDKNGGYQRSYQNQYLQSAYRHYLTNYVYNTVEPAEEEVKAYYDKYKGEYDRYKTLEKVRLQAIRVNNPGLADQIYHWAVDGKNFTELALQYHEKNQLFKDEKGFLPAIGKNDYGPVGRSAFEMKVGEIQKPLKYGNTFIVIKMLERIPAMPKFYSEIRAKVKQDCWAERVPEARRREIKRLRKKYDVKLNEGFLNV